MQILESAAPAEAYPVGEYLRDELDARGWTSAEFAQIMGRPVQVLSEILNNRKEITVVTAAEIGAATGTAAETWLRLQDTYRLWKLRQESGSKGDRLSDVERRALLRSLVPVAELVKRGELPDGDLRAQEASVCKLLGISSPDESPSFLLAARRSDEGGALSPSQVAWVGLARREAATKPAKTPFDKTGLREVAKELTRAVKDPGSFAELPARFAEVGVRLVYVSPLKGCKIDGATYNDGSRPVIALSARIQGLDNVMFTLLHEVAHVMLGHLDRGLVVDIDLAHHEVMGRERKADSEAARWALPEPLKLLAPVSRAKVIAEAERLRVHPAILVGRLHHTGALPWTNLNNLVPSVRPVLENW